MSELIITNGDAAAGLLAAANVGGRIVPWRDVLHEGPLVPAESLDALSETRATYLAARFDLPFAEARADFLARDAVIGAHGLFTRVSIWLEHDLYDQLQLLQILHFLHGEGRTMGVRLVQADDFLASQRPETILRFSENAVDVTPAMLTTAAAVWEALCAPSPAALVEALRTPTPEFPFLRPALARFIEELPTMNNGLSRTEQTIASAVAIGGLNPGDVFARLLAADEAPFLGDWSAYRSLDDLAFAREPLITGLQNTYPCQGTTDEIQSYLGSSLTLTRLGRAILAGEADMIAVNGIDRWWGGTHLRDNDCWRWDGPSRRIVTPSRAT